MFIEVKYLTVKLKIYDGDDGVDPCVFTHSSFCGYLRIHLHYILEPWAKKWSTWAKQPFIHTCCDIIHSYIREGITCRQRLCGPATVWCCWPDYGPFLKPWWSLESLSGWCGRSWSMWLRPPCSGDTGPLLCRRLRVLCRGVNREEEMTGRMQTEGNVLLSAQTQHFGRAIVTLFHTWRWDCLTGTWAETAWSRLRLAAPSRWASWAGSARRMN